MRVRKGSNPAVAPAEADERETIARAALAERASETGAGNAAAPGETPSGAEDAAAIPLSVRDVAADKAALASVVECAVQGGARLVAARWPRTALTARAVLDHSRNFAEEAGERFGAVVGIALPRALPLLGGACGMLAWGLRQLPLPPIPPPTPDTSPHSGASPSSEGAAR